MHGLPTYEEALSCALEVVKNRCTNESVLLGESMGRVLAEDIVADRDLPPFHRSQMDGYAVVASDIHAGCTLQVIGDVAAGSVFEGEPKAGQCVAIATGAPVPESFNAVVPYEQTDCGEEKVSFSCDAPTNGACIHTKGVDAKQGDVLVIQHTTLEQQHLGIAASCGYETLKVMTQPKVLLMTTGDELIPVDEAPLAHQIRNSNGPMLQASFESMGCRVTTTHVTDDASQTTQALDEALSSDANLVVTVGGISAGKRDYLPSSLANAKVKQVVKGANIQPGKPIYIGKHTDKILLCLPGNPVSALVCATIFGLPIIRKMQGLDGTLPWQKMQLGNDVQPNPKRTMFRPCVCKDGVVTIPSWQGSGDLSHTSPATGLACIVQSNEVLKQHSTVTYLSFQ